MKTSGTIFFPVAVVALAFVLAAGFQTEAATIQWTNTASGNWSVTNNWNPNSAPSTNDTAIITNAGVTVTLDISPTVGGIILGTNGAGTVTLALAGQTLTLNGPLTVNPSGSFTVSSGALVGNTNAVLRGTNGWTGGTLGGVLTLATNGTLNITVGGNHYIAGCLLTNFGTVNWSGGYLYAGGGSVFCNFGLWNAQDDQQVQNWAGGSTTFNNYGTFRKSGGVGEFTGYTYFPSGVAFNQLAGVIDVQNGTNGLQLNLSGGGNFTGGYITTNVNGLTVFGSGNFSLNGTVTGTNTWADIGTFVGTNVISGALTWVGGTWNNTVVTVLGNSVLNITVGANHYLSGCLFTNLGIVNWSGGYLYAGGGAVFNNYGLWNAQDDQQLQNWAGGSTTFNNYGTFRKSGGTSEFATATIFTSGVLFNQLAGMIDVQNGTNGLEVAFQGGGNFTGGYITTNQFGLTALSSGNFNLNGTVTGTNTWMAGTLVGTNVISSSLTWVGGTWNNTVVTVTSNSVLNINSAVNHLMNGCLFTNSGTVNWSGGYLYAGGGAVFNNYGLWNAQDDQHLVDWSGGVTTFNNYGTFRKSGGGPEFTNNTVFESGVTMNQLAGMIDVQNGTNGLQLAFLGGGNFIGGYVTTNSQGLLNLAGGNFTLNGMLTGTNTWQTGGTLGTNANVINGYLTWVSGTWNGAGSVTITPNSTLLVAGAGGTGNNDLNATVVTNLGSVVWSSGAIRGGTGTRIYNFGLWNAQSDQQLNNAYGGTSSVFNNYGTFRKSGGGPEFTNSTVFSGVQFNQLAGVVDVQNGTNGLSLVFQYGGNFTGGYITTNQFGLTVLNSGSFTLNGTVTGTNTWQDTGNLVGTNVIQGALTWVGANTLSLWNGATVTILTNSTVIVTGGFQNDMSAAVVTNYGTVTWVNGTIRGGSGTVVYNYNLWDCQSDQQFNNAYGGSGTTFNNFGTLRKSGGGPEFTNSTVFGGVTFNQLAGMMDVQNGTNGLSIGVSGRRQLHRRLHHHQPVRLDRSCPSAISL